MELWDALKAFMNWIVVPFFIGAWWMFKKHVTRVDEMERRIVETERDIAVIESQMMNIKEDISEIKVGINNLLVLLRK